MAILNLALTLTKSLGCLMQIECVYPLELTTPFIAIRSVRKPSFPVLLAYTAIFPILPRTLLFPDAISR
jgi:hypothetical protein